MRAITIKMPFQTTERQYRDLCDRINVHWRERIFPTSVGQGKDGAKLYVGNYEQPLLEPWSVVQWRVGAEGFYFRVYLSWQTSTDQDVIIRDLLVQNLETSIIPMVYFDDVELEVFGHDCYGGPEHDSACAVCRDMDDYYGAEAHATKHANESIRQHIEANS